MSDATAAGAGAGQADGQVGDRFVEGRTPDGQTAYTVGGDGAPVVLIHGLGLRRALWRAQLPALEPRFRTVRYDLLGHGDSAKPADGYALSVFAEQCLTLMDALGIDRAALVGFSLGGMIARAAAKTAPDRVSALAILNSAHARTDAERAAVRTRVAQAEADGPKATVGAALERWFSDRYRNANPDEMARLKAWIIANDARVYPKIYRVLAESDAEILDVLPRYPGPVLAMTGALDAGNSPAMASAMAAQATDSRLEIVPEARHMGLWEHAPAYNAALSAFLERASAPSAAADRREQESRT